MNIEQYQIEAKRTLHSELSPQELKQNIIYGLIGEFGEVVDYLKKVTYHKHKLDKKVLSKELGDLMWYIAAYYTIQDEILEVAMSYEVRVRSEAEVINRTLYAIAAVVNGEDRFKTLIIVGVLELARRYDLDTKQMLIDNIEKLKERYPDGFKTADSVKRIDLQEVK